MQQPVFVVAVLGSMVGYGIMVLLMTATSKSNGGNSSSLPCGCIYDPVTRDKAQAIFLDAAPRFRNISELIRKYFLLSKEDGMTGGVYLWKFPEDAERFYTDDFKTRIVERYGSEPAIIYFESPVVVDNLASEVVKD